MPQTEETVSVSFTEKELDWLIDLDEQTGYFVHKGQIDSLGVQVRKKLDSAKEQFPHDRSAPDA